MKETQLILEPQPPAGAADLPNPTAPPPAPEPPDWDRRMDQLNQQVQDMGQALLAASRDLLWRLLKQPGRKPSVADIARLGNIGSQFCQSASTAANARLEATGKTNSAFHVEFTDALRKVYGDLLSADDLPAGEKPPPPTNHEHQRTGDD